MAIDTASDRRSVAGVSVGWGVTPDATPGVEWRQQVAGGYSGIGVGAPINTVAPTFTGTMEVGQLLTGARGTWLNTPTSYADQWERAEPVYDMGELVYEGSAIPANVVTEEWADIASATSINYTLVATELHKMVRREETGTNAVGSGVAYTTQNGPVTGTVGGAVGGSAIMGALDPVLVGAFGLMFDDDDEDEY